MEPLAQLLQQAQAAVLSVQDDVAAMRRQLEECGDEAVVNPCVVDLQTTIQQKQEAAAALLKRGAGLFYESMGSLETKARALGNVTARERELEKAKKAMQRYFEAQRKAQDELRDEYDGLLSIQEGRLAHVTEGASRILQANAARRLQHRALTLWLKKSMIRAFWRLHQRQEERAALQHDSFSQSYDALAEEAHATKRRQVLRQRLFHLWERRAQRRVNARLRKEAAVLEKDAEFFRGECAKTERVLSSHLQQEHARMQATTHAQAKECELLDDEVGRLKAALAELTGEFSERTHTYVRQQDETELFFKRKEQRLREALVEAHAEIERRRADAERLHSDWCRLEASAMQHASDAQAAVAQATARKEFVFADAVLATFARLAQRHKGAMGELAELRDNVSLLAPLGDKVLRLENTVAASTDLATAHRKAAHAAQRQADQLQVVSGLLTDRLERADHHRLRSLYFMCWSTHALAKRKRALEGEKSALCETLREKQRSFLVQQQGTVAGHHEERERLTAEVAERETTAKRLQRELQDLKEQYERMDGQHCEAQMDIHKLKAQLARAEQEKQSVMQRLAAARVENLALDEDNERYSVELKEVKWLWGLHRQHLLSWTERAGTLSEANAQLTHTCEQWGRHCEALQASHKAALQARSQSTAEALASGCRRRLLAGAFAHWVTWAHDRHQLDIANASHRTHINDLMRSHEAAQEALQRQRREEVAAAQQTHEQLTAAMTAAHAVAAEKLASLHDAEVRQLRAKHAQAVADAKEQQRRTSEALTKDLERTQRQLEEVGDLVVVYCAQAAFTRWHTFAASRHTAREADEQLRRYRRAAQQWILPRVELVTQRYQRGDELLLAAVAERHRSWVADQVSERVLAGEATGRQMDALRSEVRQLRLQLATEKDYAAAVQRQLTEVGLHRDVQRTLSENAFGHQRRLSDAAEEHLQCLLRVFEEARQRVDEAAYAKRRQEELARRGAESAARAIDSAPLDVSPIASDQDDLSVRTRSDTAATDPRGSRSGVAEAAAPVSLVIPDDIQERLRTLEEASQSFAASQQRDASSLESIRLRLQEPFEAPSASPSTSAEAAAHRRLPDRRPPSQAHSSLGAALDVVRRSALCLAEGDRQHREKAAGGDADAPLEKAEETPRDVEPSEEGGALQEERRTAAETTAEPSVLLPPSSAVNAELPERPPSPLTLTPPSPWRLHAAVQTPPFLMDAWAERLEVLVSRYQSALEAFGSGLEARRGAFHEANAALAAAGLFSEALLKRFQANVAEMLRMQSVLVAPSSPGPSRGCQSRGTSPVREALSLGEPQREQALAPLQRQLTEMAESYDAVLRQSLTSAASGESALQCPANALHEAGVFLRTLVSHLQRSLAAVEGTVEGAAAPEAPAHREATPPVSGPSSRPPSPSASGGESPEKAILRDRVELLETLLVQTKVQLAEARQLLSLSGGSPPPLQSADRYGAAGDGGGDAASVLDTVKRLQEREKEMQKAHREELIRVRADTEQLVAMRYREERKRCEDRVSGLLGQMEDNNRLYEAEKAKLERRVESLSAEMAELEESHARATELTRRSLQREIDELSLENAMMQEELQEQERRAAKALAEAVTQQRELLALDYEGRLRKLAAEVKQLSRERETLQERLATRESELQGMVAEERQALEEALRRHEREVDEWRERGREVSSGASDGASCGAGGVGGVLESVEAFFDAGGLLAVEALERKCDRFLESGLALLETYYSSLLREALGRFELEREEWETENLRLSEQVVLLRSKSEVPSEEGTEQRDANDISSGGGNTASSPSVPRPHPHDSTPRSSPPSPSAAMRGSAPPHGTADDNSDGGGALREGSLFSSESGERHSAAQAAANDVPPPPPASGEPGSVTPTRSSQRSRSLDSLELSQQMLRYSRMLYEQEERNTARLNTADALTAQVDDLIARGERVCAFAERERLSPQRRR